MGLSAEVEGAAESTRIRRRRWSRFSQVFRDRFGRPPHQFLLHLRIQHAQDLLQHTGLTMREISVQRGFSDVHHFAKTFKRLSGQTPGSYRANQPSA